MSYQCSYQIFQSISSRSNHIALLLFDYAGPVSVLSLLKVPADAHESFKQSLLQHLHRYGTVVMYPEVFTQVTPNFDPVLVRN